MNCKRKPRPRCSACNKYANHRYNHPNLGGRPICGGDSCVDKILALGEAERKADLVIELGENEDEIQKVKRDPLRGNLNSLRVRRSFLIAKLRKLFED